MLPATQKELRSAYHKHAAAYDSFEEEKCKISRRLILVYCVECGLKYLIMRKEQIMRIDDAVSELNTKLKTHDFQLLLKQLGWAGQYSFEQIHLKNGLYARPNNFHEMCRYNIETDEYNIVLQYDRQLEAVMKAVKEVMI